MSKKLLLAFTSAVLAVSLSACSSLGSGIVGQNLRVDKTSGAYVNGVSSGTTIVALNSNGPAVNIDGNSPEFALNSCQKLAKNFLSGISLYSDTPTTEFNYIAGCMIGLGWPQSDAKLSKISF